MSLNVRQTNSVPGWLCRRNIYEQVRANLSENASTIAELCSKGYGNTVDTLRWLENLPPFKSYSDFSFEGIKSAGLSLDSGACIPLMIAATLWGVCHGCVISFETSDRTVIANGTKQILDTLLGCDTFCTVNTHPAAKLVCADTGNRISFFDISSRTNNESVISRIVWQNGGVPFNLKEISVSAQDKDPMIYLLEELGGRYCSPEEMLHCQSVINNVIPAQPIGNLLKYAQLSANKENLFLITEKSVKDFPFPAVYVSTVTGTLSIPKDKFHLNSFPNFNFSILHQKEV